MRKCYGLGVSCKKGQLGLEVILVMLILLVLGIVSIISVNVGNEINEDLQLDDDMSEQSKAMSERGTNMLPVLFDNAYLFILIGFWLLMLVSNFFIDTHPAFFIFNLIVLIIVLFVGIIIGNLQTEMFADDELGDSVDLMPKMKWVSDHWLILFIIIAFSSAIMLYAKGGL